MTAKAGERAPSLQSTNSVEEEEIAAYQQQISELQEQSLGPLKEDLVDWLAKILEIDITSETFMNVLDNGVYLCRLAKIIEGKARQCAREGKLTEPLPELKLRCNDRAKSGSWFARDNTANFLQWCKVYGVKDECMFESETLVAHKQEKPVIVCLLELARLGYKFGLEPPSIISMEKEIEQEEKVAKIPEFDAKPVEIVPKRPLSAHLNKKPAKMDLDHEVKRVAKKCRCEEYVKRIKEGLYSIFGKVIFIRLLKGKHLMVRVGGGWDTLEHYLLHHNPTQVFEFSRSNSKGNILDSVDGEKFLFIKAKYKT